MHREGRRIVGYSMATIYRPGMDHNPRGIGTFAQMINALRPQYYPAQESGGTSFVQSGDGGV